MLKSNVRSVMRFELGLVQLANWSWMADTVLSLSGGKSKYHKLVRESSKETKCFTLFNSPVTLCFEAGLQCVTHFTMGRLE